MGNRYLYYAGLYADEPGNEYEIMGKDFTARKRAEAWLAENPPQAGQYGEIRQFRWAQQINGTPVEYLVDVPAAEIAKALWDWVFVESLGAITYDPATGGIRDGIPR